MTRAFVAAVILSACGPLGVTADVSVASGVPPLDAVRVQVTQGELLVDEAFPLAGRALPQSVAIVSKGLTRGEVTIVVQGLSGSTVEALGTATAQLKPGGARVAVVLTGLCDDAGHCGCGPKVCSTCGRMHDGCGGERDCGACGACVPSTCAQLGAACGERSNGCGGTVTCGSCDAGTCVANQCCVPRTGCAAGECGPAPDGCGGSIDCGLGCPSGQSCAAPLDGGAGQCRCPAGMSDCGGGCTSLSTDPQNCGACGNACPGGQACAGGLCPCVDGGSNSDGHCCPRGWQLETPIGGGVPRCFFGPLTALDAANAAVTCGQQTSAAFGRTVGAVGGGLDTYYFDHVDLSAPAGACGWFVAGPKYGLLAVSDGTSVAAQPCDGMCSDCATCTTCPCPSTAAGCAQPYFCVMEALGPSVEGACALDSECPAGRYCDGGACIDAGLPACASDVDCAPHNCAARGPRTLTGLCDLAPPP